MGRPTKLTDEVQERIVTAIRAGATREAAAVHGGITERCLYYWLERGREPRRRKSDGEPYKDDQRFVQFFQAVTRAEADTEVKNAGILQRAAMGREVERTTVTEKTTVAGTDEDGRPIYATETTKKTTTSTEADWRAALEWLQRRFPDRWSRTERRELTGAEGGPIQTREAASLSDAELARIAMGGGEGGGGDDE